MLKRLKKPLPPNQTLNDLLNETSINRRRYKIALNTIKNCGGPETSFPSTFPFIHELDGTTVVSRIQQKINGKPISEKGLSQASEQGIDDIRSLFIPNIALARKGLSLDIYGTSEHDENMFVKIRRRLLPHIYSNNIIIDNNGRCVLVDDEVFPCKTPKEAILLLSNFIGSIIGLISLENSRNKRL